MIVIGISSYYHDSAVVLLKDGEIMSAVQEERFTRKKQDASFPRNDLNYCLNKNNISLEDVDAIVFYDKPFLKFERLLLTYLAEVPHGFMSFKAGIPTWLKEKLFLKRILIDELSEGNKDLRKSIKQKLFFSEHHLSHAASAFYPSPFEESAVITTDGVGEWATTTIGHGKDNNLNLIAEQNFPHSLGLLYSAFTYFCGFQVNRGEYKLMGLAPYGEAKYKSLIYDNLIDLKEDGSFKLNLDYFAYTTGLKMTNKKFSELFGCKPREDESEYEEIYLDIAASIQEVTNEIILKIATEAQRITKSKNLCMAGGVALNCVANSYLMKSGLFNNIWIQPAAGDAGGALGAALAYYHLQQNKERNITKPDSMKSCQLGPKYNNDEIEQVLEQRQCKYNYIENYEELVDIVTNQIIDGKVVGWFRGRMEYGPRALGNRSILGDPRNEKMQKTINMKIKFREGFRPFAPSVLADSIDEYFEPAFESPYMLHILDLKEEKKLNSESITTGLSKLNEKRSDIPAITHVDYTARVQTVRQKANPDYYKLINTFKEKTGSPMLVNTSFNVRGEPIVCTPEDAVKCFLKTDMDVLVLENFLLLKEEQVHDFDVSRLEINYDKA